MLAGVVETGMKNRVLRYTEGGLLLGGNSGQLILLDEGSGKSKKWDVSTEGICP